MVANIAAEDAIAFVGVSGPARDLEADDADRISPGALALNTRSWYPSGDMSTVVVRAPAPSITSDCVIVIVP